MKRWMIVALAACQAVSAAPSADKKIYLRGATRTHLADSTKSAAFTRLQATADRWLGGENIWGFPAWHAALVGVLTGDAKYCTAAVAKVDKQVSDAEAAIAAGKVPEVASDSYLGVGDMIGELAIVADWCEPTAAQKKRWFAYGDQAVSNVWHHDTASWGGKAAPWTGWGTNDPSNNYYFSFLRATMLLGLASGNQTWLDTFKKAKLEDLAGGGSLEGTGYGTAMRNLWEIYDWWQASTGSAIATKHARASMLAFLHQIVPTLDRFAPTGDQSRDSTASMFDYHRAYLAELVHLFPSDPLSPRVKYVLAHGSVPKMQNGFMVAYDFLYDDNVTEKPLDGLGTAYFASGIGQLYARSGWDAHATWLNFTAGPYTQSHAHQDQGSLLLYKDGWLAYDGVIDSHSGLRQETSAHSLVRIDGAQQAAHTTSKLVALHRGKGWLYTAADLTPAYDGKVKKVERALLYLEPDVVVVWDHVISDGAQTWQLLSPGDVKPDGTITTKTHTLHATRIQPTDAHARVVDLKSDDNDYNAGHRLEEAVTAGDRTYLHVLAIDDAVKSASGSGTTVDLTLKDGRSVTVVFGDRLVIGGTKTVLDAKVDSLPE